MYTFYILHMFSLYSLLFTTTLDLPFVLIKSFLDVCYCFCCHYLWRENSNVPFCCFAAFACRIALLVLICIVHTVHMHLCLCFAFPLKNESTLNFQILPCNILVCTGKRKFCERQLVFAPRFVLRCQKIESVIVEYCVVFFVKFVHNEGDRSQKHLPKL